MITTYVLRDGIARFLNIPRQNLEIHFPVHIEEGLEISLAISTIKMRTSYLVNNIEEGAKNESARFCRIFRDQWRLKHFPKIEMVEYDIREGVDLTVVPKTPSSYTLPLSPPIVCGFIKKDPLKSDEFEPQKASAGDETERECLKMVTETDITQVF